MLRRLPARPVVYAGAGLVVLLVLLLVAWLSFPRVGAWYVRARVFPKLEKRLGRDVDADRVKVDRGRVVIEGLRVTGPNDDPAGPLLAVATITADYDFWAAVGGTLTIGDVTVEGPRVTLAVRPDGQDNWSDLRARLASRDEDATGAGGRTGGRPRFRRASMTRGGMALIDQARGIRGEVTELTGTFVPRGSVELVMTGAQATSRLGPSVGVDRATLVADASDLLGTLRFEVEGARAAPHPKVSLTGIGGSIAPVAGSEGRFDIDLAGGYGGVPGTLWRAKGWVEPTRRSGEMHVRADRFTLDRLAEIVAESPIQQPDKTSFDASLDLVLTPDALRFSGGVHLAGLTVYHPWVAEKPIKDLGVKGTVRGRYDSAARVFELETAEVEFRGVKGQLEAYVALPGGRDDGPATAATGAVAAVRQHPRLRARLVVPQVTCQKALKAFPPEITPRLQGFKLKGNFATDLAVDIDWANLDATELGGSVGIDGCKVEAAPARVDTERMLGEFEHTVEIEKDKTMTFTIGPSNPNYVPLNDISRHVVNSLLTTEDGLFFKHKGFIVSEFRTALVKNLKAGYFKYGASSITMQFVKNLLLHREKTLSRKLQELFLTWYVEQTLDKERILEIYLNAIEYGPGVYGIGHASWHYFNKAPRDILPQEAAFFSSILPSPKKRHLQYCDGKLYRWTEAKIDRILKLMVERARLSPAEYALVAGQMPVFVHPADFDARRCRKETERIIKASRPTTPTGDAPVEEGGDPALADVPPEEL